MYKKLLLSEDKAVCAVLGHLSRNIEFSPDRWRCNAPFVGENEVYSLNMAQTN